MDLQLVASTPTRFLPPAQCYDPRDPSMKVQPAFLAVSIGAASLALACGDSDRRPQDRGTQIRSAEPRFTGGAEYAPCKADPRPDDLVPEPLCPGSGVAPAARKPQDGSPTRGLSRREERSADAAVERFERLATREPQNAGVLSDLAAAYIVRAQRRDEPYDLVLALSAADRAVAADPSHREARFNRALALELLFLDREAQAAWNEYLRLDPESGWAVEAQSRKAAIEARRKSLGKAGANDPQAMREAAENQLLGDWADAGALGNRTEATRLLRRLQQIGDDLAARGEHLVQDTTAAIADAPWGSDRWQLLVQGHRAFRDGFRLYKQTEVGLARERLRSARASLKRAGSPFAARAVFYLASCDLRTLRYAEAGSALRRLKKQVPAERYPTLRGHLGWVEGLSLAASGKLLEALRSYQEALALFEGTGEARNEAEVHALMAELLVRLGMSREAWSHGYRALRDTSPERAVRIIAEVTQEEGQPQVALYFQDELVRRTTASGDPLSLAGALFRRAQMRSRAGRRTEAFEDLRAAKQAATSQPDPELRRQTLAHISMIEGELDLATEPQKAVDELTSALDFYERANHHLLALPAHRARARGYRLLRALPEAEADLNAGFRIWESFEKGLSDEETRLAFLDRTTELVDEMIAFQAREKSSPELAFAYADRAHSEVLPVRGETAPLSPLEIRERLPEGTTLVQFSLLDDRLFIWILRRDDLQLLERPIGQEQLEEMARRVHAREDGLSSLFDLLVRPWHNQLRAGESLVFIPDKALHAIPFPALRDRKTGRYLIEDHRITVAPSATLYVNALARGRTFQGSEGRALIVGDPAFDRKLFERLSSLRFAEAEAAGVAALYPRNDLLLGEQAGVERFLALAPAARRIHFAGHAVVNDRNPLLSMLLFASGGTEADPGVLYARQIYELDLQRTDLVVLSACSTAAIPRGKSEGVTNLARAFLAAGAPNVVASLWEVDDHLTSKLFEVFHRQLRAHGDPSSALREAQLALIHDPDDSASAPVTWGAFEVFEGSAQ